MQEDTTRDIPQNNLDVIRTWFESLQGSLNTQFTGLNSGMDSISSRVDSFQSRLSELEEKVDRRLLETRPIWQQVLTRLDSMDGRLDSMDGRLESMDGRFDKIEAQAAASFKAFDAVAAEVENLSLKFRSFQNDLLRMQTRDDRLAERLERLENPPAAG